MGTNGMRQCVYCHCVYLYIDLHVLQQLSTFSEIETIVGGRLICKYVDYIWVDQTISRWQQFGIPFFSTDQFEDMMNWHWFCC